MNEDPEIFFPSQWDPLTGAKAQMVCLTCPVRTQCDDWRKTSMSTDGIWAGKYNSEKQDLKKRKG